MVISKECSDVAPTVDVLRGCLHCEDTAARDEHNPQYDVDARQAPLPVHPNRLLPLPNELAGLRASPIPDCYKCARPNACSVADQPGSPASASSTRTRL